MAHPSTPNNLSPASVIQDTTPLKTEGPSLFSSHLLEVTNENPQIHLTHYDYWVAGVLFLCFVLFVWMYVANRKKLNQLIRGFYTSRSGGQLSRDENAVSSRTSFLLSLLFLFIISLYAWQVAHYYGFESAKEQTSFYTFIILALIGIYFTKIASLRILGHIFKAEKEAAEYGHSVTVFTNLLGLCMLPVVICLAFMDQVSALIFIYAGAVIIVGFLCVRIARGIAIGLNSPRVSRFYLFLYLCALEILPFVILLKLFLLYAK